MQALTSQLLYWHHRGVAQVIASVAHMQALTSQLLYWHHRGVAQVIASVVEPEPVKMRFRLYGSSSKENKLNTV